MTRPRQVANETLDSVALPTTTVCSLNTYLSGDIRQAGEKIMALVKVLAAACKSDDEVPGEEIIRICEFVGDEVVKVQKATTAALNLLEASS